MARKRKGHKAHRKTTRRRRIGALSMNPGSTLMKVGAVAVGYLAAAQIDTVIKKATGTLDPKIVAGAELGLGALLLFSKGKPSMIKTLAGGVLAGVGLKSGLQAFGVINGYSSVPVIAGYSSVPAISGYTPSAGLNGYNPSAGLNGYKSKVMGGIGTIYDGADGYMSDRD